ncbi:hypothetical protein [Burkholderia sp. Ax-1724]|uniref:hypothetical protein n=1 Tax=Burkholderia sp. Ax-1724 TaxID=2608336 RepID=UPI0014240031|nr:hypothetical protein [Burkholderia sp. Ax-1724]NIF53708.1 hypothetical protein [Burkholderia sp. Ax-1724]
MNKMFPFSHSFEVMKSVFQQPMESAEISGLPEFPPISNVADLGLPAVLVIRHMEIESFPRYLGSVRKGYEEVGLFHYQKDNFHTFVSFSDELGGRNAYVLTNSIDLVVELAQEEFSPPPPWIAWCHYGPFVRYNEGAEQYWDVNIWTPFWRHLMPEARDAYIDRRSVAALAYMSDEEWGDWVYSTRKNDPEYRERHGF